MRILKITRYKTLKAKLVLLVVLSTGMLTAVSDALAMTFEEVCALPTTVSCWDFDTVGRGAEADIYYCAKDGSANDSNDPDRFLRNHIHGPNNCFGNNMQGSRGNVVANTDNLARVYVYPKRDHTHSEFPGGASLKFRHPSQSGPQTSGDFIIPFKRIGNPPNSTFARFGAGGEFWIRWAERDSAALVDTIINKQPGGPGAYGGTKRLIVHGHVSSPGGPGGLQYVVNDGWQRQVMQLYSDSGQENLGIQDIRGCPLAAGDGTQDVNQRRSLYTDPPCKRIPKDQWVVYHLHVKVAKTLPDYHDGEVRLYMENSNGTLELLVEAVGTDDGYLATTFGGGTASPVAPSYSETGTWENHDPEAYGKLSFTLFSTAKDNNQVHFEGSMWIDNVIVSRTAVPRITGPGVRPMPPTGLRVQ